MIILLCDSDRSLLNCYNPLQCAEVFYKGDKQGYSLLIITSCGTVMIMQLIFAKLFY